LTATSREKKREKGVGEGEKGSVTNEKYSQMRTRNICHRPLFAARIVNMRSAISPDMALRLSKALGRSPESWLAMQHNYDLWRAKQCTDLSDVKRVRFEAA